MSELEQRVAELERQIDVLAKAHAELARSTLLFATGALERLAALDGERESEDET